MIPDADVNVSPSTAPTIAAAVTAVAAADLALGATEASVVATVPSNAARNLGGGWLSKFGEELPCHTLSNDAGIDSSSSLSSSSSSSLSSSLSSSSSYSLPSSYFSAVGDPGESSGGGDRWRLRKVLSVGDGVLKIRS